MKTRRDYHKQTQRKNHSKGGLKSRMDAICARDLQRCKTPPLDVLAHVGRLKGRRLG